MACEINTIKTQACVSGIGKVRDPIQLLQLIAQLTCEASEGGGGGDSLPSGSIIMWSGTIATIPSGWAFCNGANGTPDLRNRFVVSAQSDDAGAAKTNLTGSLTVSGGSISHTHGITDPGHVHAWSEEPQATTFGGDEFSLPIDGGVLSSTTGITVNSQSAPQPYYALAFIMKL
jgi:hypothetical protein